MAELPSGSQLKFYLGGRYVPVFPLPNVVLFPRVPLPLYIFEPRYRMMLSDVLDSHGRIAMALIQPGSPGAASDAPDVFPVMGVGHVLTYDTRSDGTSNVLLVGEARARVVEWEDSHSYRLGVLEELSEVVPPAETRRDALRADLEKWVGTLMRDRVSDIEDSAVEGLHKLQKMLGREKDTGFLVDFIAHHFVPDPVDKQALLEELDVEARAAKLYELLGR